MCDVYKEICFSQKTTYKWAKRGFATTSLTRKHTDSPVKKKFLARQLRTGHVYNLLEHERTHHRWFFLNAYDQKFLFPTLYTNC